MTISDEDFIKLAEDYKARPEDDCAARNLANAIIEIYDEMNEEEE